MTLAEFVAKYAGGPPVGGPPGLRGQCVALADLYAQEVYGDQEHEPFPENAVDIFGQRSAPGGYKWIRNDPNNLTQVPPRGALMVWGGPSAVGTGPLGHVDIVLDATGTYFNGLDQNWPLGAGPRVIRHSYVGVIGWGYPQIWDAEPVPIVPQSPPVPIPPAPQPTPAPVPVPAPPAPAPVPSPLPSQPGPVAPPPGPMPSPAPSPEPAHNPPVQNPPVVVPDLPPEVTPPPIPEPPIVAEQGVTTSEWAALVRYGIQAAGVGTAQLANVISESIWHVGVVIPNSVQLFVGGLELAGALAVAGYALSRGIRKLGVK